MLFNRPRSALSFAAITVGMLIVLSLAGCRAKKPIPTENVEEDSDSNPNLTKTQNLPDANGAEVRFPRRLLFIQISQYTSLNPLGSIEPGKPDQAKASALQLAQGL
ncbi:MAG TPA: hypothetical protein VG097_19175, partial [Gemmata sp.]|nr:hypothetical protein [Gemmata sp.]